MNFLSHVISMYVFVFSSIFPGIQWCTWKMQIFSCFYPFSAMFTEDWDVIQPSLETVFPQRKTGKTPPPARLFCLYVRDEQLPSGTWKWSQKSEKKHLTLLCDLFGTIRWPEITGKVTNPTFRESDGHGWNRLVTVVFFASKKFWNTP